LKFDFNFFYYYLDLVVDASVDEGVNGCYIRSITSTTIDNCLQPGDFIVSINHESMRKISNAQARSIIRRASLIESDIRYSFIKSLFYLINICFCLVLFSFRVMKLNNLKIKHSMHKQFHPSKK